MTRAAGRGGALVAFLLVLATAAAACGSSSASTTSPTPSPSSATTAASIKANWIKFFDGTTGATQKIALLQNGQQFASTIRAQAQSPLAQSTAATVASVKVTSATTATVNYSILLNKQVALADQTGQAILQGGVWKVSAQSFQALLALEGAASPSASASP
jgi:hypothetical protein